MKDIGQLFRMGVWTVKQGKVPEFIEAWQSSAGWLVRNLAVSGEGILLQDPDDPVKFVSFGSASNLEEIEELMSGDEFQELWTKVLGLCEDVQPRMMKVVARFGS